MIELLSFTCRDCERPWCATRLSRGCPYCGSPRVARRYLETCDECGDTLQTKAALCGFCLDERAVAA